MGSRFSNLGFRAIHGLASFCFVAGIVGALPSRLPAAENESDQGKSSASLHEFITGYCLDCHSSGSPEGDFDLEVALGDQIQRHSDSWERVVRKLRSRQMPPVDKLRPTEAVLDATIEQLTTQLDSAARKNPQPGRTSTFRRLTRFEYQNAIRDLLALDIDAEKLLPPDQSSHGFDNVTVGDLPPALLTRYIQAARDISKLAIGAPRQSPDGHTYRIAPDVTQEQHVQGLPLGTRGGILLQHTFPRCGEYEVHVRLARDRNEHVEGLNQKYEMEFLLDRRPIADFTIVPPKNKREYFFDDEQLKARMDVSAGPHDLGITFIQDRSSLIETKRQPLNVHFNSHRHPRLTPAVYQVSITGPFHSPDTESTTGKPSLDTPSRQRVFGSYPAHVDEEDECAEQILSTLARRAYRRPVSDKDLDRPLAFYRQAKQENGFEAGIEMGLSSILVSPRFLFRIERDPEQLPSGSVYAISDLELASRLSFFLWSSIPDDELLAVAQRGELRDQQGLKRQLQRMLSDPRSEALVNSFASQWLYLRNLDSKTPDARRYPDFDDNLRQAFRRETELVFQSIIREDRSVLDLLQADYTFLNERLAKHYGIPHVYGSRFRRVELSPETHRGGLLRHGSILTVTSYATRTSPVIRGHWVLENILGAPTPPPPPNVPALEEVVVGAQLPIRERLARHRDNAVCASCHNVIDPIGFGMENYDAVGRWRETEFGQPVDARGAFPGVGWVDGIAELEAAILQNSDMFVATMTEKLLTYALGRGMEEHDRPAIRGVVAHAAEHQNRFSEIIGGIVASPAFQMRTSE